MSHSLYLPGQGRHPTRGDLPSAGPALRTPEGRRLPSHSSQRAENNRAARGGRGGGRGGTRSVPPSRRPTVVSTAFQSRAESRHQHGNYSDADWGVLYGEDGDPNEL